MRRVLLLNADYSPLNFITDQRAMEHWLGGRAEVVTGMSGTKSLWEDMSYTTVSREFPVPATIRLYHRVKPKEKRPLYRKKVIFNRDKYRCQYCDIQLNSNTAEIEHIFPRSRGGKNSWLNCVTACHPCNKRKRDQTPQEAGMKLLREPKNPSALDFWDISKDRSWHDDWDIYVGHLA